ncbi:putative leucine-rich repeat receptor-like protein kinase [Forsythia ovata]|uniref:Leucine-rich repeat receptor-like protein kinase n=1 Tax=Forsythia ovata TaxID=205694 RepID=A0ABD1UVD9_9LAMI
MLELLDLSGNKFHGEIPPSLLQCHALQTLVIFGNEFSRSIPYEIGILSTLQYLDLSDNDFTELNIGINSLHGQIPESIFNLSMLQALGFANNSISGNLPSSIANGLLDLEVLYIGGNRLSGEIPRCISNFSKLTVLDLTENSFSGRVPMNLGNLQNLQVLRFSGNQLTNDPSMLELDFLSSLKNCGQLKEDMVAHVVYFGIAKLFTKDQIISLTKTLGTIGYMAPGQIDACRHGTSCAGQATGPSKVYCAGNPLVTAQKFKP